MKNWCTTIYDNPNYPWEFTEGTSEATATKKVTMALGMEGQTDGQSELDTFVGNLYT